MEEMLRFDDRHDLRGPKTTLTSSKPWEPGNQSAVISNNHTGKFHRRERNRFNIPVPGQPGALDDPRRKGLNGSCSKWYLLYLSRGFTPDVARQKAEEHRTTSTPKPYNPPQKRTVKCINDDTLMPSQDLKLDELNDVSSNSKQESVSLCEEFMAILPKNYPQEILSIKDLMYLEYALITEIARGGWETKLKFKRIVYKFSMLLIRCETQETADWLRNILQSMEKWKGPKLVAYWKDELPDIHIISGTFPNKFKQGLEVIYNLIEAQNEGINTDLWKILEYEQPGNFIRLTILIDGDSKNAIEAAGYKLFFKFSFVKLKYKNDLGLLPKGELNELINAWQQQKQQEEAHENLTDVGQIKISEHMLDNGQIEESTYESVEGNKLEELNKRLKEYKKVKEELTSSFGTFPIWPESETYYNSR